MDPLSKSHKGFCENAGVVGVLIGVGCLIQHFIVMGDHWMVIAIMLLYMALITGFVLLAKLQPVCIYILSVAGLLLFGINALYLLSNVYSLLLIIFLCYTIVIVVYFLMENLLPKLQERIKLQKEDDDQWRGII
jgi:hypothetical protein